MCVLFTACEIDRRPDFARPDVFEAIRETLTEAVEWYGCSAPLFCLMPNHLHVLPLGLPEAKKGFVLLPRRYGVEPSFAWSSRFKRLAKDDERLPETPAGFLAFSALMLGALGEWIQGA